MQLEEYRRKIDKIDAEILDLLNRRARLSRNIGHIKASAGLAVIDLRREDVVIRRVLRDNAGQMSTDSIARIYGEILSESRRIQLTISAELNAKAGASQ